MAAPEWLTGFKFAFAAPGLEQSFQGYLHGLPSWWSFIDLFFILTAWCNFAGTYFSVSTDLRALLPPTWYIALAHPLASLVVLFLFLRCPSFYLQHRALIGTCASWMLVLGMPGARAALFWRDSFREPATERTMVQTLRAFSAENMYLSVVWFNVLVGDHSRHVGLLMNTVWMLADVMNNKYMCELPYTRHRLVSTSPQLLEVLMPVTQWVRGLAAPHLGALLGLESVSCPVALGVWQIVGWWFSCHCIVAKDIVSRRAFLRTAPALQILSRGHAAWAMKWPFGNGLKVLHLVLTSVIIFQFCVIWLVFLSVFD